MAISVPPARNDLVGLAGPALLARESDERLVELARDGDENAFAAIVDRYRTPLERHCRRTLPPARAEDALQQAFASAYVALSRGARPAALRPWLYTIAHNAAINGLRDRQAESLEVAHELGGGLMPHEVVTRRESLRSVVRAVVGLPSRQRQVILRQEFDGESQDQIARELGLTTGAVRQLAHRARCTVRAAAAGLIPAPLWQRMPWPSGPSEGAELVAGSALGAVVAKTAAAILVAGAAGGAVELTSAHAPAPAAPAARTAPRQAAVAVPPAVASRARPAALRATAPAQPRRAATSERARRGDGGRSRAEDAERRREAGADGSAAPSAAHETAPAPQAGSPASGAGQQAQHGEHAQHGHGAAGADAGRGAGGHGRGRGRGGDGGHGHGHGGGHGAVGHDTSGAGAVSTEAVSAAPVEAEDAPEVEDELAAEPEAEVEVEPESSGVGSGSRPPAPEPSG